MTRVTKGDKENGIAYKIRLVILQVFFVFFPHRRVTKGDEKYDKGKLPLNSLNSKKDGSDSL